MSLAITIEAADKIIALAQVAEPIIAKSFIDLANLIKSAASGPVSEQTVDEAYSGFDAALARADAQVAKNQERLV